MKLITILLLILCPVVYGEDYLDGAMLANSCRWVLDAYVGTPWSYDTITMRSLTSVDTAYFTERSYRLDIFYENDTANTYIIGYDTTIALDSTVCDSTYEYTLTDEDGKTYYVNLIVDCNKYYSTRIEPICRLKILYLLEHFAEIRKVVGDE